VLPCLLETAPVDRVSGRGNARCARVAQRPPAEQGDKRKQAGSEDEASALAEAIRQEAPASSLVRTGPNPWAHFVIRQAGTAAVPYYHFD
jgi:hypothetical protein